MMTVLLVIHLMVAAALVAVVLLQKSEGGALGIGGGGSGSFLSGRGQANFLTRVTAALALAFFITSLSMTFLSRNSAPKGSVLDAPAASTAPAAPAPGSAPAPAGEAPADAPRGGILDKLK